jgi:hypothetical protein
MLWLGASNVKVYPEILDGIGVFIAQSAIKTPNSLSPTNF